MKQINKLRKAPYRLLGIDPGTNVLGYAVIEVNGQKLRMVELGVLKMAKFPTHAEKLQHILERVQHIIKTHRPEHTAIEAPFFGKNVQSMLKLGRAQGVAIAASMTLGVPVTEYSPRKIKQAIAGNGNASKEQVAALLEQAFGIDLSDYLLDATDALAVAGCHYYQNRLGIPVAGPATGVHSTKVKRNPRSSWADFVQSNPGRTK